MLDKIGIMMMSALGEDVPRETGGMYGVQYGMCSKRVACSAGRCNFQNLRFRNTAPDNVGGGQCAQPANELRLTVLSERQIDTRYVAWIRILWLARVERLPCFSGRALLGDGARSGV